jgi:signal recognition particle subunit SRP19
MDKGVILYPCYFDSDLMRSEGRRVPRTSGVQNPDAGDIERILKKNHIQYSREPKSHPAYWWKGQGRIIVEYTGSKGDLIHLIGSSLKTPEKS